jgi:hydrogenase nickel incorporation protein HypB
MCDTCGCGDTTIVPVAIQERLLADNDRVALHNRDHFATHGILAVNVMGSPGAGKTALLEATAHAIDRGRRLAAITGDLETDRDARRLIDAGIRSEAITTGSACHLDARMIHDALHRGVADGADTLFIENVGNLVCPAIYDLGQAATVVVLSVTEGEDKPLKYAPMFRRADLVVLSKVDLLPALPDFDRAALADALAHVMPEPRVLEVSARWRTGIADWVLFLEHVRARTVGRRAAALAQGAN